MLYFQAIVRRVVRWNPSDGVSHRQASYNIF
jgi:hypothetical protein